jgi:hypothetical protein
VGAAAAVSATAAVAPLLLPLLLAAAGPEGFSDDFQRGLCTGACRGWNWPATQQIDGSLAVARVSGGQALRAHTAARGARVPKAALIARPARLMPGQAVRISFDLMVPAGAPLNSIHLVDLECATCGEAGNPGIRLYLRDARLRIDRSKIGERHAWTNDAAPQLRHGRWHAIVLEVTAGLGTAGRARVLLDGAVVLEERGATILRPPAGRPPGADRVQIGLTASSNAGPATAYFDNVAVSFSR